MSLWPRQSLTSVGNNPLCSILQFLRKHSSVWQTTIAGLLHYCQALTGKKAKFERTAEYQTAFEDLHHSLVTAPVLAFTKFSHMFILDTDASAIGIGAAAVSHFWMRVLASLKLLLSSLGLCLHHLETQHDPRTQLLVSRNCIFWVLISVLPPSVSEKFICG